MPSCLPGEQNKEDRWAEVQKKITPWRLGIQEQEPELQLAPQQRAARLGKLHGALLVVASLIDKPTNLGGGEQRNKTTWLDKCFGIFLWHFFGHIQTKSGDAAISTVWEDTEGVLSITSPWIAPSFQQPAWEQQLFQISFFHEEMLSISLPLLLQSPGSMMLFEAPSIETGSNYADLRKLKVSFFNPHDRTLTPKTSCQHVHNQILAWWGAVMECRGLLLQEWGRIVAAVWMSPLVSK